MRTAIGKVIMLVEDGKVEFMQAGHPWTRGSDGARGNRYVGPIRDPYEAQMIAAQLQLWAAKRLRDSAIEETAKAS